ncbi:MAG: aspartate--tRNA ligase [Acidimicrobiaceae bacterium]|nr:aspartate--tRNA ligase [Acidimicrobiaceae bacterium]MYB87287.1 aspartate--tRNA ligase [Acidimicrobiaceae bacterium]
MTGIDATAMRTDLCGRLGHGDAGRTVTVCGWVDRRREHSEHLAFVDLRDHSGVLQCVVDGARDLRSEYVVRITGTVRPRPEGTANPALATGEVELQDCEVELLSRAQPPPFPLDERTEVDETLRLRHRYVDLRKPRMQHNLRARAAVNGAIRRAMDAQGFVEVETPMLIASTPEGARDFVVPSRKEPGSFYALPQSPQIFKQLTMVGGVDRYYQIARCLRDEDLRADRQFEFSQLDVEASFATRDDVLGFVTRAVSEATIEVTGHDPGTFDRMTWHDAMERFGSDKPDTRFGMELAELTPIFAETQARVFQAPCVKGICLTGGAESLPRSRVDELVATCQRWGAKGLAWMRVVAAPDISGSDLDGGVAKFLSAAEAAGVIEALDARPGDMVFLVADKRPVVRHVLGLLRLELGRPPVNDGSLNYLWVVDFPLFEGLSAEGEPIPSHHPFTMPHENDLPALMDADGPPSGEALLDIRSQAYDLVLNGWELGSGSVRIHRREVQQRIFEVLGIAAGEAQERFGFLLDAFRYGAPPHAGFAVGLDRLAALLVGEENIREVIAFPKTQSGTDPLTDAPSPIADTHLQELGLRVLPPA